jgi:hypothetical protein
MSGCPTNADAPLTAAELRALAVLMAVSQRPESPDRIAEKLARLDAPGLEVGRDAVAAAVDGLADAGAVGREGGAVAITEAGRARAWELGGRTPGSACDSARVCLLLRLCLDGVMPAANRRLLVRALLAGGDVAAAAR